MENNEVILENEINEVEANEGTNVNVSTANGSGEFLGAMKKVGAVFAQGMVYSAGTLVMTLVVAPKIVAAAERRKAKKEARAKAKPEVIEVAPEEQKNVNPYSAKTEEVFKSFKK